MHWQASAARRGPARILVPCEPAAPPQRSAGRYAAAPPACRWATALGWQAQFPAASWPATRYQTNAVTVRIRVGYGADGTAVPAAIRQWMLLQISHWYEHRESVNVGNIVNEMPYVAALLDPYRILEA